MPSGMKLEDSVGIPMPRFAYIPSLNSRAARLTIFSRINAAPVAGAFSLEIVYEENTR